MATNTNQVQAPGYLRVSKAILWVFYAYILIGVISLALRIFLLLFSANSAAGFYKLVINTSADYLQPFRGIFPAKAVGATGYFDVSAMFAIVVYLFILWGIHSLVNYTQNKIDISKAEQEKELAQLRQQAQLAATKPQPTRRPQ